VVYLIFNEGYNSSGAESVIREDLCGEALRLGGLVVQHPRGDQPRTRALMALMSFQAARFDARLHASGDLVLLPDQDRTRWDRGLIHQGVRWLAAAAEGDELSTYHLEAGIAGEHSLAADFAATNWNRILQLYDLLVQIHPTPVHRLNRAIAIAYAHGPQAGLNALGAIPWSEIPQNYYLFDAALGELHRRAGQFEQAQNHLQRAIELTASPPEQRLLAARLHAARNSDAAG
jgi:RNA polymerase sigma-70 factor (ECF subfamily)